MSKIIKISQLNKSLIREKKKENILQNINLTINQGEMIAIMGPSGSGKSTLLGIIGTIDSYDSGEYLLDDTNIKDLSEDKLAKYRNENIGIVFQSFQLLENLSAIENVMAPMFINKKIKNHKQKALDLLDKVGLLDKAYNLPKQLSGGQQQRVAIARALANDPKILLADEPTGNLDSTSGKQVIDLIKKLQSESKLTVILVTHDPNIASNANRVIYIVDGKIHEQI